MTENLKKSILGFIKISYKKESKVPSLRKIILHFKDNGMNFTRFYSLFPEGLGEACHLAGVTSPTKRVVRTSKTTSPLSTTIKAENVTIETTTTNITNGTTENIFDLSLPVVTGKGLSSQHIKIGDLVGKPMLIESIESWCPHCQAMAPIVDDLHKEYRESVTFLSVAGIWEGANAKTTAAFIRKCKTSVTFLLDEEGKVFDYFNIEAIPTFLFYDSSGRKVNSLQGEMTREQLITELKKLK